MKTLVAITFALLSTTAFAQDYYAEEREQQNKLLAAIAGGYLGSTIGSGDGRTAATVLGAIIGYRHGDKILEGNRHKHYVYDRPRYRQADIYKICEYENPYPRDSRFYWQYNRGCVQRLSEEMRQLEQYAYEQGYKGNR
jgi:uncharacterized protein YcfJ